MVLLNATIKYFSTVSILRIPPPISTKRLVLVATSFTISMFSIMYFGLINDTVTSKKRTLAFLVIVAEKFVI